MKPIHLLFAFTVLGATACHKNGLDAFADDMCACSDAACVTKVQQKYADLPELKLKLKDSEALPADKKAALGKAMSCAMKLESAGGDKPSAAPDTEKKAEPKLAAHTNAAMGYTIDLPEGSTTTSEDKNAGMYSFDTMVIQVEASGVALKTPDDLLRGVDTGDGKLDKKTEGNVVEVVVTKQHMPLDVYAGPIGARFSARCMAEPSMRDLAMKICKSLRAK